MSKELAAQVFDYSALSKDAKGKLIYLAGEIRKQSKAHASSGLELGRLFAESRGLLGESFKTWVERESWHSVRSAYNYILAWENFGDCANLHNIELSAMYELAKNEKAKNKALKLAEKGVKVTHAMAKELVEAEISDKGKPGGEPESSSLTPASSGPASGEAADSLGEDDRTDSTGTKPQDSSHRPPRSGKDKPVVSQGQNGPLNDEPEAELTFAERVKSENGKIESFCRLIIKHFEDNCPNLESINYQGRYDSALAHVRSACGTLRTCKYHSEPCPKCSGDGCSKCERESDFGAVTVITYQQLAG